MDTSKTAYDYASSPEIALKLIELSKTSVKQPRIPNINVVRMLLENGVNINPMNNTSSCFPESVIMAEKRGHTAIAVELLLAAKENKAQTTAINTRPPIQ